MSAIICKFSAGLDDLTRKQQADAVAVLRVLERTKRYSVFEATDNAIIARTMDRLHRKALTVKDADGTMREYGQLINRTGGGYPWVEVEVTEGGLTLLADASKKAAGRLLDGVTHNGFPEVSAP